MNKIAPAFSPSQLEAFGILSDRPQLLWGNVAENGDGCWHWVASVNQSGYGSVRVGPTSVLAHRAAYVLGGGALPAGACVCHRCDTPSCCNPAHLFIASHGGNMADMKIKGRRRGVTAGERNGRAKLTASAAASIRVERTNGASLQDLASRYGVAMSTVSRVCRKENWA